MSGLTTRIAKLTPKQRALLELRRSESTGARAAALEPIAVVGIGCRFPGGVTGPESYWRVLEEGRDTITEVPPDRWDVAAYYDPDPDAPGKTYTRWGGFVDNIDRFDPRFFGITPREAAAMDPQQRMVMEVSCEALEDAGQPWDALNGTRTGVFMGLMTTDYSQLNMAGYDPELVDVYSGSGVDHSFAAGRLSYFLGARGPSMVVTTACSSALVATHLACQSLRAGECNLALAGGVNAILSPEATIYSCRIRSMAFDGRCKTFDAAADGYVRSEGCGIVVLKRLSDAVRNGDNILALIRGSAMNHDGRSAGLTVPSSEAQKAVIRAALANGSISPEQVGYVEAHGTGTPLGDSIEVRALWSVFGPGRTHPLMIGSAKTNLGHLEAASGAAGLIKTILALHHKRIPPHLHLDTPNPQIEWDQMRIEIPTTCVEWNPDGPRIAGVSSFGLSGMNAHAVLEEAPEQTEPAEPGRRINILPVSARSADALGSLERAYETLLSDAAAPLSSLCWTAGVRRSHLEWRAVAVGSTAQELRSALAASSTERVVPAGQKASLGFVFPGQGGQYVGMGRTLIEEERVFREAIEECDETIRSYVVWSLVDLIRSVDEEWLSRIDRVQPAVFGIQVALAALWRSWGIVPDSVIGHSMGEVAAAHVAGILTLDDAARIICRRSSLLNEVRSQGAMLLVELAADEAAEAIDGVDGLSVAAANGPRSTVVAGPAQALDELVAILELRGVYHRRVHVDVAAHTAQVDPLVPRLTAALGDVKPQPGHIPFYSTVYGQLHAGEGCGPDYWAANLRQPVRFCQAVQGVLESGCRLFLEIGPHPTLSPSIHDGLRATESIGLVLPSLRRGEDDGRTVLESLGALYVQGRPVAWRGVYEERGQHVSLPTYPWERERYWLDSDRAMTPSARSHAVLSDRHEVSSQPGTFVWDLDLSLVACPYLADHRVEGTVVVPAAAYLTFVLTAAESLSEGPVRALENVRFKQVLAIPEKGAPDVQLVISGSTFQFVSRADSSASWMVHVTGRIADAGPPGDRQSVVEIIERCGDEVSDDAYYDALEQAGLGYGPAFRGIVDVRRGDDEALARLRRTAAAGSGRSPFVIHPTLIDACFQVLGAATRDIDGPALPTAIDRLEMRVAPEDHLLGWARMIDVLAGEVCLLDEQGDVYLRAEGLRLATLGGTSSRDEIDEWLYTIKWEAGEPPIATADAAAGSWLILPDSRGLASRVAGLIGARGERVVTGTQESIAELVSGGNSCHGILYLAALDDPSPMPVISTIQALAKSGWRDMPRFYVVTSRAVAVDPAESIESLDQAPLWGLGRTIALEHPEFACTRIDVPLDDMAGAAEWLCAEVMAGDPEDQIAYRSGERYVARLVRYTSTRSGVPEVLSPAGDRPFRLEIDRPGILDNLTLRTFKRRPVGPDEVEIEVRAAGLNFLDVLSAMGIRPDTVDGPVLLGGECSGVVTAVGREVVDLRPGDAVIAIGPSCFATHVVTKAALVVRKPASLDFAAAAAIPVASLTAYYALVEQGRLRRGERVLIHSASGGTGLAAVGFAQHLEAEIFATAGTPEKRAFLQSLGVCHVMDSRSTTFAGEVRKITDGRGVDVILNSLTGDAIAANLSVLAPYGRFLEIGKRDIYQDNRIALWPFRQNLSYFAIDLARMVIEQTDYVREMLRDVVEMYASGSLEPLTVTARPVAESVSAFHAMANAQHVGKIVLTMDAREAAPISSGHPDTVVMRADGTYLITGGMGGLGLVVAAWLAARGAGHLLLVGRSVPGEYASRVIEELRTSGAEVTVAAADVAQRDQLAAVLDRIPADRPLRGVFHAAAILDDAALLNLDEEKMERVWLPKVGGARNLADLTRDLPLDHVVFFSSAASVMGSPGQAHYGAANAYLDALAQRMRREGKRAISINWGPWAQVGLAAAQANRGERLAVQGIASILPEQGLIALDRLMSGGAAPQVAVMPLNLRHWRQIFPGATRAPFLARLMGESNLANGGVSTPSPERVLLQETPAALRRSLLEGMLRDMIARVLRMTPDQIDADAPLVGLGLDSLMSLELRNRLELSFGVTLSATLIFTCPTISALAPYLAERMEIPLEMTEGKVAMPAAEQESERIADLARLSDAAAETLLTETLAGLGLED